MKALKARKNAGADRRRFPRVSVSVPVMLESPQGKIVTALMHNVSPGGMQVRLSSEAAADMLPGKDATGRGAGCPVRARFLLPLRNEQVPIAVNAAVVHVSVVQAAPEAARVAVGLRFKRFSDSVSLRRFVMYLEEQMVPLEDYDLYLNGGASARTKAPA